MKKILLDTDAGVDDILAILLLLRCPDLAKTVGMTLVAGNTTLDKCIVNVRRALGVAALYRDGLGRYEGGFPIAAGAAEPLERPLFMAEDVHGPDGLGGVSSLTDGSGAPLYPEADISLDPRPADELILDLAAASPGEITLVAIGPLTNLALAVRRDPRRFGLLKEIVLMGGAFRHDGNVTPRAEFNIFVDPEAAALALAAGVPVTIVPLDCSERARFRRHELDGEGPVHAFVRHATGVIIDFHRRFERFEGCFHHDPLAVAIGLDSRFATGMHTRVVVETKGEHTVGETVAGLRPDRPLLSGPPNAFVCLKPDPSFERFFLDRVLPEGA
ncbi:MAG TPA: nucleoside hydrolase [Armatimonadota bacterium]